MFLLPSLNQLPYNIIRCNQDRFLYYLSVYVKSFKELFSYLLVRGVFLKSECKSTNYFPNTQEFRRKSLKINSYLTVGVRNKRLYSPLSLYCTRGSAGCACAGAQAEENMMFSINKALHSDFPKPAEDLQRIFMQYIHAVIAGKRDPNWKTISSQLEKYFFPTGKLFFSQLSTI